MYFMCAVVVAAVISAASAQNDVAVTTSLGVVTGSTIEGVDSFLGIQFAAVGERFSRSTLITNENGQASINATSYGPYCYQLVPSAVSDSVQAYSLAPQDEECLYLNIWRPSNITSASLPVMFYVHGGGFYIGSGAEPIYNGSTLAKEQEVIVVTTNYRLGVFGFLVTNETTGDGGLNAMHDVINALTWVQEHISDFGGDPSQVTIFGESAGSFGVCMLSVSPLSKGLFHRSIMQSGQCALPLMVPNTPQVGYVNTRVLFNVTNTSSIDELRAYPADELAQLATFSLSVGWATIDGFVLPTSPFDLYQDPSSVVPTDVMIGSNSFDDFNLIIYSSEMYIGLASMLEASIAQFFPENNSDIIQAYSPSVYNGNQVAAYAAYNGDLFFGCATREIVNLIALDDGNIYLYHLAHLTAADPIMITGLYEDAGLQEFDTWASHGADLPLVFGTTGEFIGDFASAGIIPTTQDLELGEEMMTRWASFAKTGDPNVGDYMGWEPVAQETSGSPSTVPSFVLQPGGGVMMNMDDKATQCSAFPFFGASSPTVDTSSASLRQTAHPAALVLFIVGAALVQIMEMSFW